MQEKKTLYTISKDFKVYEGGVLKAHGFNDMESSLKAVHVLEGGIKEDFYTSVDGIVFLNKIKE